MGSPRFQSIRRSAWLRSLMSLRRRPRLSAMIHPSSNAISVMKPRVLRLAVFASWTLSGSCAEKVSAGRLCAELGLDRLDEVVAEWAEIRNVDTYSEDREEGARVGEQQTSLPLDPDDVQVPVVV